METINDRIEQIINHSFEGNKSAFAKALGLPASGLSSYLSKQRRSVPGGDLIAKIVSTMNVDARWLLTGDAAYGADAALDETPVKKEPVQPKSELEKENVDLKNRLIEAQKAAIIAQQKLIECQELLIKSSKGASTADDL